MAEDGDFLRYTVLEDTKILFSQPIDDMALFVNNRCVEYYQVYVDIDLELAIIFLRARHGGSARCKFLGRQRRAQNKGGESGKDHSAVNTKQKGQFPIVSGHSSLFGHRPEGEAAPSADAV